MWLRVRQICLVTHELEPVVESLKAVFGLEVCHRDPGVRTFGLENALLPIGNQFLEVVAPIEEDTAAGRYLERRGGEGGYMVIMQCDDHTPRKRRVAELGVRVAWGFDQPEYLCMQLHPKDTGGSFLEIDYQPDGDAPDGPWWPAGPNWWPARRTDVVSGIARAELQSPDFEALGARWSDIVEIPLSRTTDGDPEIRLENASLYFVRATDGRPEGLGGITLTVKDRAHVLAAADARGCRVSDDLVLLCGTRFRLDG